MRNKIPDIINCSPEENYTQMRNDLLRNPEISLKAKGLLGILVSNREGWYSYQTTLLKMVKESKDALATGMKELEAAGYLLRLNYRDKLTGRYKGLLWSCSQIPHQHNLEKAIEQLETNGWEFCDIKATENLNNDRKADFPVPGFPGPNNINYNKTKEVRNRNSEKTEFLSGTTKPSSLNKLVRTSHKNPCKFTPENFFPFLPEEWRDEVLLCSALGKYLTCWEKKGKPLNMRRIESHSKFLVDNSGGDLLTAIRLVKKATKRGLNGFWPLRREWWMDKDGNPNMSDPDVRQFMAARGFYPDDEQRDEDIYHPEEGEGK